MKIIMTALLFSFTSMVSAQQWDCRAFLGKEIILTLKVASDGETGTINIAGITHTAFYYVAGFDRRFDFGFDEDDSEANYSVIIDPSGIAGYYDFTIDIVKDDANNNMVSPSNIYMCKEVND